MNEEKKENKIKLKFFDGWCDLLLFPIFIVFLIIFSPFLIYKFIKDNYFKKYETN